MWAHKKSFSSVQSVGRLTPSLFDSHANFNSVILEIHLALYPYKSICLHFSNSPQRGSHVSNKVSACLWFKKSVPENTKKATEKAMLDCTTRHGMRMFHYHDCKLISHFLHEQISYTFDGNSAAQYVLCRYIRYSHTGPLKKFANQLLFEKMLTRVFFTKGIIASLLQLLWNVCYWKDRRQHSFLPVLLLSAVLEIMKR